jgi:type IV pilus assembly protein PilM
MPTQPGAWGIEIGQCALKALRVENRNGVATATAFEFVEHPKILSQPDADPDLLTREALEKFLKRNQLKGDKVAMCVSGQSGLARFVKLPPVEEKKISDIVKFEAKQQIPFPLEEVVWDFQKIGSGVVADGFAMETEIGLFAIKRENVQRALQPFQEIGVEVDLVQMSPLALCNFVSYDLLKQDVSSVAAPEPDNKKKECVVALDIGVETSSLIITDGNRVIWQRSIPIGGNRFTRALTKEFKYTFAKAEHLKRNATKSPDLKRILLALRADLNEFVNEVQKSLSFFTNSHRDAHIQYLVGMGGAFRLPGLQKFLNEKLQMDVRKLGKFMRLEGANVTAAPLFSDNALSMGVVYGLALQGLGLARLRTNLLPEEIRVERLVRNKKPWAVAAAAMLLVGAGALAFSQRLAHDAVASEIIGDARKNFGKPAIQAAEEGNKQYQAKAQEVDQLKKLVRSVVAGQEERINWLMLNKHINDCLPRPDLANLTDKQKAAYGEKGKAAYDKFLARQAANRGEAQSVDDEDLVLINLESCNSLYCDDLSAYFNRLKEANKVLDSMPKEDQEKPPTGAGWIVELRGYTNHRDQRRFVTDTLIENLAHSKRLEPKADATKPLDPISGKITHVVLLRNQWVKDHVEGVFELINRSELYPLATGNKPRRANEVDPPARGEQPGGTGKDRSRWKPLANLDIGFKSKGDDWAPPRGDKPAPKSEGRSVRTEFVIYFIWREPTPSDDDLKAVAQK